MKLLRNTHSESSGILTFHVGYCQIDGYVSSENPLIRLGLDPLQIPIENEDLRFCSLDNLAGVDMGENDWTSDKGASGDENDLSDDEIKSTTVKKD